jgi:hypothetical protein
VHGLGRFARVQSHGPAADITGPEVAAPSRLGPPNVRDYFVDLIAKERTFLALLLAGFVVSALTYDIPSVAMWVGFAVAGYSAVANDSIQTIGTFIASNRRTKWWLLWLFIGGIFLVTVTYSWVSHDGDVTYQRLAAEGFDRTPTSFSFLQVAAPLFLLVLTRLRMPVSTTFLLLSSFAATASGVESVLVKSVAGYGIAFGVSLVVWLALSKAFDRWFTGEPHVIWRIFQWATSGLLWSIWLMQDAANIAVYLPRSMSVWHFLGFAAVVFFGLGLLFRMGGDRIQKVVEEKSGVVDVRAATMIALVYAAILYVFKISSNVPMSTTWVFIGLLGGRELAMAFRRSSGLSMRSAWWVLGKDLLFVTIGLVVSLVIAYAVNDAFRQAVLHSSS